MKIFLTLVVLVFILKNIQAQIPRFQIEEGTSLQTILPIDTTKDVIYTKLIEWLPDNFTDENSGILSKDSINGKIEGKGNLLIKYTMIIEFTANVMFDYTIDIKDGKISLGLL